MVNMTTWVAPAQGCAACHNVADFADDAKYTKRVARRMLQMVRHINGEWTTHVKQTGVTCYTCHRGNLVPPKTWYTPVPPRSSQALLGNKAGQNARLPADVVGMTSLPNDPFTPFLQGAQQIRVIGPTALPTTNRSSIKQAEWTYGLMMHMSEALGVNCTYCHNTRAFYSWQESVPQRVTAWYGIRMVRDINNNYITPLAPLYVDVPERKGPAGDLPKVFCATCHNGVYKPLFGASMLQGVNGFPELREAAAQ
jgi:photosynthetic reaction center cytochrome c subunit